MDRDWIDVIREKLLNYEEPVPDDLWDRILATLEAQRKARLRRRIIAWTSAAAAAVALGVFAGINLIDNSPRNDGTLIAEVSQEHRADPATNPSSSADIEEGPVSSGLLAVAERISRPVAGPETVPVEIKAADQVIEAVAEPVPAPQEPVKEEAIKEEVVKEEIVKEEVAKDKVDVFQTDHDGEDWSGYSDASVDGLGNLARKLVAGLSLSSSAEDSRNMNTVESGVFFMGTYAPIASNDGDAAFNGGASLMSRGSHVSALNYASFIRAESEPVTKDENHRRPVRASLSLSYPLSDVLWLESGLTYSLLYSTFTTSSGSTVTEDSQTLGYLGIPLNLRANVFQKNFLDIYVVGGGMAEKCLNGSVRTSTTVSGTSRGNDTSRKLTIKPLQWSANAAAGLQANLAGNMGLYVEPGLSYHFASGANVRSIYTEHPLDFILTFGARFSFN